MPGGQFPGGDFRGEFFRGHFSLNRADDAKPFISISIYQYLRITVAHTKSDHFVTRCPVDNFRTLLMGQTLSFDISHCVFHIDFQSKSLWEPCNKVGSQILAVHLVRIETTNFQF